MPTVQDEYDFGFTFSESDGGASVPPTASNEDLKLLQDKVDSLINTQSQLLEEKYKAKLKEVEALILPLLYNLMKNPDKAYIKWEGREAVIKKQIERITAITRG